MTQEDKQLLLTDLCARLAYGVLCEDMEGKMRPLFGITPTQHFIVTLDNATDGTNGLKFCTIDCVKPYLRPMSSMTKEETKELFKEIGFEFTCNTCGIPAHYNYEFAKQIKGIPTIANVEFIKVIDWLNKKMFDYRGLIEKGLAIAVTKENNHYKE